MTTRCGENYSIASGKVHKENGISIKHVADTYRAPVSPPHERRVAALTQVQVVPIGVPQRRPVEQEVVLVVHLLAEKPPEQLLAQVRVIGRLVEAQPATVVEIQGELLRVSLAQRLHWSRHLLLADLLVLLFLGRRLETLPRERAPHEVHDDVPERLEVVPPTLLDAEVGVDAGVPSRARQTLALLVGDVGARSQVAVLLRQAEVDKKHLRRNGLDVTRKSLDVG